MTMFWAKTGVGDEYLSLERHLADAGAAGRRLWDIALTDRQRAWFAAGLGLSVQDAGRWVTFLCAAHDIGKASAPFQTVVPTLAQGLPEALLHDGLSCERLRHDQISGAILHVWLRGEGLDQRTAYWLAATISGHHGTPRSTEEVKRAARRVLDEAPLWAPYQQALTMNAARGAGVSEALHPRAGNHTVAIALAGLVSVADWIASDASRFPVTVGPRRAAEELARDAVVESAWSAMPQPARQDFATLFGPPGEPRPPRATQAAVVDALQDGAAGRLVIVEDRTGSGKTEAALWAVGRALDDGARGVYIGMPTRATADQLHARATAFLQQLWPDELVEPRLLHGGITPSDPLHPDGVSIDDRDGEEVAAQSWFAAGRRGLLAPLAVGTIDQALLGCLCAKHYAVRLWGLQGKVVVIDECHAYDFYTGLLLERMVEWLAALDCTVVLLSATLPTPRRDALTAAFRSGSTGRKVRPTLVGGPAATLGYPRVTVADSAATRVIEVTDDRPSRTVGIGALVINDESGVDAVAARLLAESADGGCVGVVCSTVGLAQERFRAVRALADADVEIVLLHARLRPIERGPIERRLIVALGPDGEQTGQRPYRLIVVATQIIEQSLDIDFDLLLTDLAPVDLLIQRAGRVHRHAGRTRPDRHAQAQLLVIDSAGDASDRAILAGTAAVYGDVETTLQKTRLALRGRTSMTEPDDLDQLIGTVYDPAFDPGGSEAEQQSWRAADERAANLRRTRERAALAVAVSLPSDEEPPWDADMAPRQDPDSLGATGKNSAATRWTDRISINVVVLEADELVTTRHAPNEAQTQALLSRAVSLSHWGIVGPVIEAWQRDREGDASTKALQPKAWKRNPRLRDHILVELDETGWARPVEHGINTVILPLRLDLKEGVVVEQPPS